MKVIAVAIVALLQLTVAQEENPCRNVRKCLPKSIRKGTLEKKVNELSNRLDQFVETISSFDGMECLSPDNNESCLNCKEDGTCSCGECKCDGHWAIPMGSCERQCFEPKSCEECPYGYNDGCNECFCEANGQVACTERACFTLGETYCKADCRAVRCGQPTCEPGEIDVELPGQCCKTCIPDPKCG